MKHEKCQIGQTVGYAPFKLLVHSLSYGYTYLCDRALTMLMLDRTGKAGINYSWSYTGGADGARRRVRLWRCRRLAACRQTSLLGAVAGSMISVAATAFSITIVALQLAASNFGPRLLRNFMQPLDIKNKCIYT
jgi:uncharacterized membrane protein